MSTEPEKIVLTMDASGVEAGRKPLRDLIGDLQAVQQHVTTLNAALNGLAGVAKAPKFSEVNAQVLALSASLKGVAALKLPDLAKAFNFSPALFERFVNSKTPDWRAAQGYRTGTQEFGNLKGATRAVAAYQGSQARIVEASGLSLAKLLSGRPTVESVQSGAGTAEIVAALRDLVPQLAQAVANTRPATVAESAGAGREAGTGKFAAGGGGGGGGGGKKGEKKKGTLNLDTQGAEILRVRKETADTLQETITTADALGNEVATTFDSVEGEIRKIAKTPMGRLMKRRLADGRAILREQFKGNRAGARTPAELAVWQRDLAAGLESLIPDNQAEEFKARGMGHLPNLISTQARALIKQAEANEDKAAAQARKAAEQERQARLAAPGPGGRPGVAQFYATGQRTREQIAADRARTRAFEEAQRRKLLAQQQATYNAAGAAYVAANLFIPDPPKPKPSPFARGLKGFTPTGIASNILNVSQWALSVGILYKSIEGVTYALGRMTAVGEGTARLANVFHGLGGSARQLAGDLVGVAAATGQASEGTLASGADFARIYRSRGEVSAAVGAAAKLSTATGMDLGRSGNLLGQLARVYGIGAGELGGTANTFLNLAQKYRVDPAEMATEAGKNAAYFKQAGIGPNQMLAMLMGTNSQSGLAGSSIGSMMRASFANLQTIGVQDFLRQRGIRSAGRPGGEVLGEIAGKFGGMSGPEQLLMGARIGGQAGATRWVEMMKAYAESLASVNEALAKRNTLEEANSRIMQTMGGRYREFKGLLDQLFQGPIGQAVDRVGTDLMNWAMGNQGPLMNPIAPPGMPGPMSMALNPDFWGWLFHGMPGAPKGAAPSPGPNRAVETNPEDTLEGREAVVSGFKARTATGNELSQALWNQLPHNDLQGVRWSHRAGLLAAEETRLGVALDGLQVGGVPGPESMAEINRLDERRREARAELDAARRAVPVGERQDARALGFQRAGNEADASAVGRWKAEQLLNREKFDRRQLLLTPEPANSSENDKVRALQLEADLMRTQEAIQERIVALRGEEKQIMIDANREFARSLITAGPGELLKKMVALQAVQANGGRMSAGKFFALDPEVRRNVDELRGGARGAAVRGERRLLGPGLTIEAQQAQRAAGGRAVATRGANLMVGGDAAVAATLGQLAKEAAAASGNLVQLAAATAAATVALERLATTGGGGSGGAPAAAPGGVNTGHALGTGAGPAANHPRPMPSFSQAGADSWKQMKAGLRHDLHWLFGWAGL